MSTGVMGGKGEAAVAAPVGVVNGQENLWQN